MWKLSAANFHEIDPRSLLRLDVGGPDHLGPLFSFIGDKIGEMMSPEALWLPNRQVALLFSDRHGRLFGCARLLSFRLAAANGSSRHPM
jgi:hypothetical protein